MDFTPFPQLEAALYRRSDEQPSSPLECHNHILQGSYLRFLTECHYALPKKDLYRREELKEHVLHIVIDGICDLIRYIKRSLRPKDIGRYRLVLVQVVDRILDLKSLKY
jgi:hypothetical protein